jgi:prepilin-type N-terminal cleavage/methylation domain-containing protein/prepilin-type processing-associated H-X9-DG protein
MKRRAFSIVELLVAIGILAILLSIILPSVQYARELSKRMQCAGHQREIVQAWGTWSTDNNYKLISLRTSLSEDPTAWVNSGNALTSITDGALYPYLESTDVYRCPNERLGHVRSYSGNAFINGHDNGYPFTPWPNPITDYRIIKAPDNQMVFVEEADPRGWNLGSWVIHPEFSTTNPNQWIDFVAVHHSEGDNVAFADGHVEMLKYLDDRTLNFVNNPSFNQVHANNADLKWYQSHYVAVKYNP